MRLAIDFRMHNASGIGTYIRNVIPHLVDRFDTILLGNTVEIQKYSWSNKVRIIDCNLKIYSIKEQLELPLKIPKCDIFWSPHYNISLLPIKAKRRMVTIYDVFHLAFYETLSLKQKLYAKLVINQAVKRSDVILTISQFSKEEITKYTHTKKPINVIYPAVDLSKFKVVREAEKLNHVKLKYKLPERFILFVGNVKPHKNLKRLLMAIKNLDLNLVIAGKKEGFITGDTELSKLISKSHSLRNKVTFTGYVEDEDLPIIYNLATMFVFPSLYEGFGLPPLEAQACGCPVIVSNVASLPEVCGDSALYCNPYDANDIRRKIEMLINDEKLQEELRKKGFENVKRFSWKKSARKIIKIIERLL